MNKLSCLKRENGNIFMVPGSPYEYEEYCVEADDDKYILINLTLHEFPFEEGKSEVLKWRTDCLNFADGYEKLIEFMKKNEIKITIETEQDAEVNCAWIEFPKDKIENYEH